MSKYIMIIVCLIIASACGAKMPSSYKSDNVDREVISLQDECRSVYERPRVIAAVAEFANLTTYGNLSVTQNTSDKVATVGIIPRPYAAVYTDYESAVRDISPQLGEYVQSIIESLLVETGVSVVSRSQLDAILSEQQFQMTIADPDTIVEFGMLTGANYIITGSVDNIKSKYTNSITGSNNDSIVGIVFSIGSAIFNTVAAGWTIDADITINIVDVTTGKITATQRASGTVHIGDARSFKIDTVIAGAKAALNEASINAIAKLNKEFDIKGYVNEMRGKKTMALVTLGKIDGVKAGDKLVAYDMYVQNDFRTGSTSCALIPLDIKLEVTEYVDDTTAWVNVKGSKKNLKKFMVGTLIKKQ